MWTSVCIIFVNNKGGKQLIMNILTIKHFLSLVVMLFPFHGKPVVYKYVKIIWYIVLVNNSSILKEIFPTTHSTIQQIF